jgi:tetratricopeptide (TPR) repeat protein
MYWRYFREQFLGAVPTVGSFPTPRRFLLGLLPFVGMLGVGYHARKNRETFALFGAQFLIGGLFLIFYMNFTDHEVRERDYFYAPSFFYFATWIGLGFSALFEWTSGWASRRALPARPALAGAAALSLAFPALLFWQHFPIRDQRGNRIARNYAYNMLVGLEKDAMIFTNGDNDTFPLWYLQEVEGIRKDVRVLNLSLLNTPWYIRQLKNLEPKVPISFTDDEIERLRPFRRENTIYMVKDIAALDIIRSNDFRRPIYFAVTVADLMGFDKQQQLSLEGLAFRMTREKQTRTVDVDKTIANMTELYNFDGILDARGDLDRDVYRDENTSKLITNYAAAWARIAFERRQAGDKDGAIEALGRAGRISPDYRPFLAAMGALLLEAERFDQARAFYEESVKKARTPVERFDGTMGLGMVYEKTREYDAAAAAFRSAMQYSPESQEPFLSLYNMYLQAGRPQEAVGVLREWLERNPSDTKTRQRVEALERQIRGQAGDTVRLP